MPSQQRGIFVYLKEYEGHYGASGISLARQGNTLKMQSRFLSRVCIVQTLLLSIHDLLHLQEV